MPKVPVFTARTSPGVAQYPMVTPAETGEGIGKGLLQASHATFVVAQKLQEQSDELDTTMRASQYDQGVQDAKQKALAHPIPTERAELFKTLLDENLKALQEDATSDRVRRVLYLHQQRTLPEHLIQFHADNLHQQADANTATLDRLIDKTAQDIPKMPMAWQRDEALATVRDHLDRAVQNGLMHAGVAEAKWQAFREHHLEADMQYRATTDPQTMRFMDSEGAFKDLDPNKRLKILAETNAREMQVQEHQEKAWKKLQDGMDDYLQAQANQGAIPADIMDRGLKGHDPIITDPATWREYQRINEHPPIGGNTLSVRALMQLYHLRPSTLPNIAATRRALNELARFLGHPSEDLDKAANELQTDERTMRSVQAAEMQAGIHYGEDLMKSKGDMQFPGRLGQMQKNLDEIDKAEMRTRIRKGEKPDAVVKDITERKTREKEAVPKRNKGVMELVQ